MQHISPNDSPDEVRRKLMQLKDRAYSLSVLFTTIRQVVEKLEVAQDMSPEQVDTIVFNTMMDRLSESDEQQKGGE